MTPEKYIPESRDIDDKDTLRRLYWGDDLLSVAEIADRLDAGEKTVRERFVEFGIPTRVNGYKSTNSVSPFAGFYSGEPARTDDQSTQHFDPDHESQQRDPEDFEWAFTDYGGRA